MSQAFIISIGDELNSGEILNTNAVYIADQLINRGIYVTSILTLPDEHDTAVRYIRRIINEDGVYIFTGGLGGTRDDITRGIISEVFDRELRIDREKAAKLKKWYTRKKRDFVEKDIMQASYPDGGRLLDNETGLAYGFFLKAGGKYIFSLPGVPKEMESMFNNEVIPILAAENRFSDNYRHVTMLFSGIGEYTLDRRIDPIISRYKDIKYGTRAGYGLIKVRVESIDIDIAPCVFEIEKSLNRYYISRDEKNIEQVVGEWLKKKHLSLSVAESCTAGLLSKVITDVPGSSGYFLGGVVSYSNEIKKRVLGVKEDTLKKYGAVSSEIAGEMARGVQERLGSDISLAVTGIAGPGGGSKEKPVGTVFVCLYKSGIDPVISKNTFPGGRETMRMASVNKALFMLLKYLQG
ncbi:MAG TPA: CinA family nicotinamide mononucleotide deamidase-related protein [Spirochaetes bacterium]|nr:CinA family nicotinamide mononucleotide deamidase-related protein [Spirochaetota bacterium]